MNGPARTYDWPSLMVDEWTATRDTLHMWVQIVGKIRMVHMPLMNHWWQVTLYVSPRGLTTGAVPYRDAVFDMEFDFVNQILAIRKSDGRQEAVPLAAKPVAEFYGETLSALDRLGIETHIVGKPNEVDPAIPFAEDYQHAEYDPDAARSVLAATGAGPPGHDKLSRGVRRKGQPGPILLGCYGFGVYTIFRAARPHASGRSP